MDLEFAEEQDVLRRTARSFLEKECDRQVVRELECSAKGYSPELWRRFAELGWLGLGLPEDYGGVGGSLLDLVVFYEELGRALCPSPHLSTVVLCGSIIAEAGTPEQKQYLLPRIANGELMVALAFPEACGSWQADDVHTAARREGEGFVLEGTKLFVHWAAQADELLVVARSQEAADPRQGITLFLVDAQGEGITYTPLVTIAGDKQVEIVLRNVSVPATAVVGWLNQGWPVVQQAVERALVALSGQMVGGCEQVLQMAADYAKARVQFDRPIGSFQAIQHYLADIATEITGARTLTYRAAWTIDEGLPGRRLAAMAKAQAGDTYCRAVALGAHILGGPGYTVEGDMQLYFRRAKGAQLSLGPSEVWEEVLAQEIGL